MYFLKNYNITKKRLKILQKENNREEILVSIKKILEDDFEGLYIIRMNGNDNYFRCRIGKIRIIFYKSNGKFFVDKVGYRGDIYK